MLTRLEIRSFAVIEHAVFSPSSGLNVISGETGAGKSLLIDAIGLIFGEKASKNLIRSDSDSAYVEAVFDCDESVMSRLTSILDEYGIPYQRPAGGHAIFVDADKVLTNIPKEEFPAQTLTCELYLEAGIRACEIGYVLADRDPVTRENRFGGNDFVRLCIPRRVYTNNHMDVIAAALKNVYDRRNEIKRGLEITWEAELMRHFTCQFKRLG